MSEEVQVNPQEVATEDARLLAENIAEGKEKAPKVDFEADYAAAQEMSVSNIEPPEADTEADREIDAKLAEKSEDEKVDGFVTGNSDDYLEMANEIVTPNEAVAEIDDDLIKKALDLGKPANT